MRSRILSRLVRGEGERENEALVHIGGALVGVALACALLVLAFGVSYLS
jgi:hypothetical protein